MNFAWTKREKKIAKAAFDLALERECKDIINEVKNRQLVTSKDLWTLCDMLEYRRREVDRIYEYSYSHLTFVFCKLLKRGTLNIEELDGLATEKLEEISKILSINV